MREQSNEPIARSSAWLQLAVCTLFALGVLVAYVLLPQLLDRQALVLPLDDVYIHFQYAKQLAAGQPYIYNPGLPPSSGATSLLYPYLLAVGQLMGLQGLALGWWALLLGTMALVGCCWLLWRLAGRTGWVVALLFVLTGGVSWHFMSGMETGLLVLFMLTTLYAVKEGHFWLGVGAAALMAVTRPEGAIMAVVFSGVMALRWLLEARRGAVSWGKLFGVVLPTLALGLQPLVNQIFTGQAQAAGSSAKSILSMVPAETSIIAGRIAANFGRMWWEFLTGYSLREGLYLPAGLAVLAALGLWQKVILRRRWDVGLLVAGWLMLGTLAVATLDPAFWHFKRYQVPFMALLFPLAGWGLVWISDWAAAWARNLLWGVLLASALVSGVTFWRSYQLNTGYLRAQQVPMANWLQENTPPDAVVAVHDVGLMRYLGERTTVDMVGLTTPGAADSWRNGPGALAEFLTEYDPRPDYVASYTDALGLSYLADTGLYGEELAAFPAQPSDRYNVALAGAFQGVWRIEWEAVAAATTPKQRYPVSNIAGMQLVDTVDVADLASEAAHDYVWENAERLPGFPTEVYEQDYAACASDCMVLDGGRRINGVEAFTLATIPGEDLLLVTRLHPAAAGAYTVYINGQPTAVRTLPNMPGQWLDVAVFIAGADVQAETRVRVVPNVPGSHYMPYTHWAYQGNFGALSAPIEQIAAFGDTVEVSGLDLQFDAGRLVVDLNMSAQVAERADYRVFLHVYDDLNAPPVAQADRYPLDGATPPGNWLPGTVQDTLTAALDGLPNGDYTAALGFYDPTTGQRLMPRSSRYDVTQDGRLLLGEFRYDG